VRIILRRQKLSKQFVPSIKILSGSTY